MPSSQRRSLAERRRRWNLLVDNRRHIVADLLHLDGDLGDLDSVSKDVEAMVALQARYLANLREVTAKLRTMARKGDRLRGRIGASLRGQHGFDAIKLIQFGFKPRRTKSSSAEEAESPALASTEEI
jgi:hypothetical protein